MRAKLRGITLVELVVSLALSLTVISVVVHLYLSATQSLRLQETLTTLEENGRYALDVLARDIRNAGFYGPASDPATLAATINLATPSPKCKRDNTWGRMLEQSVFGMNNAPLPSYSACVSKKDVIRGDVLLLRYAAAQPVPSTSLNDKRNQSRLYLVNSTTENRIIRGNDRQGATGSDARIYALNAHLYFVGKGVATASCTKRHPSPALLRKYLSSQGLPRNEELVQGIENIQLRYGLDTDDSGSVNRFVDADKVDDWRSVRAVRVWVLARALCPETGYRNEQRYRLGDHVFAPNDNYRRQVFSQTVTIRNRVLRKS